MMMSDTEFRVLINVLCGIIGLLLGALLVIWLFPDHQAVQTLAEFVQSF